MIRALMKREARWRRRRRRRTMMSIINVECEERTGFPPLPARRICILITIWSSVLIFLFFELRSFKWKELELKFKMTRYLNVRRHIGSHMDDCRCSKSWPASIRDGECFDLGQWEFDSSRISKKKKTSGLRPKAWSPCWTMCKIFIAPMNGGARASLATRLSRKLLATIWPYKYMLPCLLLGLPCFYWMMVCNRPVIHNNNTTTKVVVCGFRSGLSAVRSFCVG